MICSFWSSKIWYKSCLFNYNIKIEHIVVVSGRLIHTEWFCDILKNVCLSINADIKLLAHSANGLNAGINKVNVW